MPTSLFQDSERSLDDLQTLDEDTLEAPPERLGSPAAARANYEKLKEADGDGSFNRSLIDGMVDFSPPHDDGELENKGQSDRFNITTGEGPAIINEAVAAYMDIYVTPKILADIPLLPEVDKQQGESWSQVLAEEYTAMDRADDASLPLHLQLATTYVKHGVAIPYFDDKDVMQYSVGGLDHFKFPREMGVITSDFESCFALGEYSVTDLYAKIRDLGEDSSEWNPEAVKTAILESASQGENKDWDNWELIQRDMKANEMWVSTICLKVKVIHSWVKEFDGKISYYICTAKGNGDGKKEKDEFLFKARGYYNSVDQAFQIFPFSVGNGGRLYTVRGLGYLVYQLCNAMDVLHCKMLDNARVGSSLILQPATTENAQDMMLIDAGSAIMLPPGMTMPDRQVGINLNNALVPAINASRDILNRATGGLASGNMMMQPEQDRRTKLEVSSQLDYINKLNSFAVNLFYGPYDKITREKVRRAFSVVQKDKDAKKRIKEMKQRCLNRGVPEEIFGKIDFSRVKATRIIGTGSRASRIMLMDQVQQGYSTWDAAGRKNFDYDRLIELIGVDKAERYAGKPNETRTTYDDAIARLENFQLLEGDMIEPQDGQLHMVHLPLHIEPLEAGLQGVDEGAIDLMEWTVEHNMLFQHCVATLEITVVHESVQPELNTIHQRVQQIGEIVTNGLKMINKAQKEGKFEDPNAQPEMTEDEKAQQKLRQELEANDMRHKQKMQHEMQISMLKLENIKKNGQWKQVLKAQEAMAGLVAKSAEAQEKINRIKASQA